MVVQLFELRITYPREGILGAVSKVVRRIKFKVIMSVSKTFNPVQFKTF